MLENRPPTIVQEPRSAPDPYPTVNQRSDTYDVSGAASDEHLIAMWLSGRPATTVRAYSADVARLRAHVRKPIRQLTASDLIDWAETLARLKPASQYRMLSAVKSLFSYAHRLGYLTLDPAAALRMPRTVDDRGAKLLPAATVQAIIGAASGRDRIICLTLYITGIRESELIELDSSDLRETPTGYALAVRGKGNKLRTLAIPQSLAAELLAVSLPDQPIFRTTRGNRLDASDVYRIVRSAGEAVGARVTPHALRHAHASHALDAGAPLHLVRDSLGHASLSTTSIYSHAKPTEGSALYVPMPPK